MTAALMALILKYSLVFGVDPKLVIAVIQVESEFKISATGEQGEVGLMQLMPQYFPKYSKEQLRKPRNNLRLGIEHLARSLKDCKHQPDFTGVVCYNMGVRGGSRVRFPKKRLYYKRVMKAYNTVQDQVRGLSE